MNSGYYPKEAEQFTKDTAEHQLTVLRDDGLYRHLRFKAPSTGFYWFDLITWPGSLTINGDMGTHVFSRVEDMFTFFRSGPDINPGYWSEKARATNGIKTYSEDLFKQLVTEHADQHAEEMDDEDRERFLTAVREQILECGETYYEHGAREALDEFRFSRQAPTVGGRALGHRRQMEFTDTWEWDLTDYTHQFLWCCFAIRWGIEQYDALKAAPEPVAAAS